MTPNNSEIRKLLRVVLGLQRVCIQFVIFNESDARVSLQILVVRAADHNAADALVTSLVESPLISH